MLQTFCVQELQDGAGMDTAPSALEMIAYLSRPISVFVYECASHFALHTVVQQSPCLVILKHPGRTE